MVVGRTTYCPPMAHAIPVGGTKNPDLTSIHALSPDVVLAVREENRREDVEALRAAGLRVEVYEPLTVSDAAPLARDLGRHAGDEAAGDRMATGIESAIEAARAEAPTRIPVTYLVWREPYLAAGRETWIGDVLATAGFPPSLSGRYPEITPEEMRADASELILLSSEPYPFRESHAEEMRETLGAGSKVLRCRGDLIGWYPSRLPAALDHLFELREGLPPCDGQRIR